MNFTQSTSHERWIGWTLRAGVWLSGVLLLTGLLIEAFSSREPARPLGNLTLSQFFEALAGGGNLSPGELVLYAGILVLVFTPVVRVFTAGITFLIERDWKFVAVSAAVFAALLIECIISSS